MNLECASNWRLALTKNFVQLLMMLRPTAKNLYTLGSPKSKILTTVVSSNKNTWQMLLKTPYMPTSDLSIHLLIARALLQGFLSVPPQALATSLLSWLTMNVVFLWITTDVLSANFFLLAIELHRLLALLLTIYRHLSTGHCAQYRWFYYNAIVIDCQWPLYLIVNDLGL